MRCGDCRFYKNPNREDWYSVPLYRWLDGAHPYAIERLNKGELTEHQIKNDIRETCEPMESLLKYHDPNDIKFLATRKYGNCQLTTEHTVNNESNVVGAYASDDHGLEVFVGENFGCIHFDKKEGA